MKRLDKESLIDEIKKYKHKSDVLCTLIIFLSITCIVLFVTIWYLSDSTEEYRETINELNATIEEYEYKKSNDPSYFDTDTSYVLYYDFFDPVEIIHTSDFQVIYDDNTGVMYYRSIDGSACPILHICGCPKIWNKISDQVMYHDTAHRTSE